MNDTVIKHCNAWCMEGQTQTQTRANVKDILNEIDAVYWERMTLVEQLNEVVKLLQKVTEKTGEELKPVWNAVTTTLSMIAHDLDVFSRRMYYLADEIVEACKKGSVWAAEYYASRLRRMATYLE